ncbi:Short chain dehydrogenase [Phytophthora megakarya]|uniref:Short chain dehydrogenase n=1 Tax=Phytophthora megakarya TaxID=4795 RepID=A0A225WJ62_9STRA|nr:Short chain dehydrogenase [Phytophthora megakarya]
MVSNEKTIFILGSTRGIGLAIAEHYAKAGWKIIGTARASSNLEKLEALSPFKVVVLDASDEASVSEVARQLKDIPIDLLINNAGVGIPGTLTTATKDDYIRQFEVNSIGPFLVTRALLPNLELAAQTNGTASVAQISSIMGSIGNNTVETAGDYSMLYGYSASKVALNMIMRTMAIELRESNILMVSLHPGCVVTELTQDHVTKNRDAMTPAESAAKMAEILAKLTPTDTGKFLSADSNAPTRELPW